MQMQVKWNIGNCAFRDIAIFFKIPELSNIVLENSVIKLNETHLTILKDLDTALTNALETLQFDESNKKYVVLKDLQNEDKGWYLVYDLIHYGISNEEMRDEYLTKRAAGNLLRLQV